MNHLCMKVLSIDVGIKNLAFCLLEMPSGSAHFKISKWDVVNIATEETYKCQVIEKNKPCIKPAKFIKNNQCFCLKHSKKNELLVPSADLKPSFINKQKIQKLMEIAAKYNIKYDNGVKKADLIHLINDFVHVHCFEEIGKTNASKVDLVKIGMNLAAKFNILFADETVIDYVIIENQISPIANRMKTIQGMIVQYFIMSSIQVPNIEFVSAGNKLKNVIEDNKKTKYSERKKLGIQKCTELLTNDHRFTERKDYFLTHKKKDDLADALLQGLWFLNANHL